MTGLQRYADFAPTGFDAKGLKAAYLSADRDGRCLLCGAPRGYVLRVIPPSYAARNRGRDRHNREAIGVPARDTGLRF